MNTHEGKKLFSGTHCWNKNSQEKPPYVYTPSSMCHAEGLTNSHRHGANNNTLKKKKYVHTHLRQHALSLNRRWWGLIIHKSIPLKNTFPHYLPPLSLSQASHLHIYITTTLLTLTASLCCPKLEINNFQLIAFQDICSACFLVWTLRLIISR